MTVARMTDSAADIVFGGYRYETAADAQRAERELAAELAGYLDRLGTVFATAPVWESAMELELWKVQAHHTMPVLGEPPLLVWDDLVCPRLPEYDYSVPAATL